MDRFKYTELLKGSKGQVHRPGRVDQCTEVNPENSAVNLEVSFVSCVTQKKHDPSYLGSDHPDKQPCQTFSIPAFNGRAQVLIQSGQQPSTVTLKCAADGLKYGLLTITTR